MKYMVMCLRISAEDNLKYSSSGGNLHEIQSLFSKKNKKKKKTVGLSLIELAQSARVKQQVVSSEAIMLT